MDIVIQGGLYPATIQTAKSYSDFLGVDKVIVSCWEGDEISDSDQELLERADNIILLGNEKPDYVGPGNLNLHIISSQNGIKEATSDVVMKIRSDQRLYHSAFQKWNECVTQGLKETPMTRLDGSSPKGKVFVIGMNYEKPYHPQDHIFWGYREDVYSVFDIPFSNEPPLPPEKNGKIDFSVNSGNLRNPIYIGMHYFSRFSEEAKNHAENYKEYLLDSAPKWDVAMENYEKTRDSIFKILPRIDDCMWWEKFNSGYWYDVYHRYGERYE